MGDIGANSKGSANDLGNAPRFVVDLFFRETDHLEAARSQIQIATTIVLESHTPPMMGIAIGFHRHKTAPPKKVDEVRPNANINFRHRQAIASAKREEVALQVAACAVLVRTTTGSCTSAAILRFSLDRREQVITADIHSR